MKVLMLACLASVCLCAHAQNPKQDFEKLHLLVGTWKMESAKGILFESWQKVSDSVLKGISYKLNGKDTVLLEQVDLVRRGMNIQYIPVANGQNNGEAVIFTLSKTQQDIYTFENLSHDFPQVIVYRLPENNTLHAWIEGKVGEKNKRVDYKYTKAL